MHAFGLWEEIAAYIMIQCFVLRKSAFAHHNGMKNMPAFIVWLVWKCLGCGDTWPSHRSQSESNKISPRCGRTGDSLHERAPEKKNLMFRSTWARIVDSWHKDLRLLWEQREALNTISTVFLIKCSMCVIKSCFSCMSAWTWAPYTCNSHNR